MVQVLFVCLGNICRSPMAEAVFRKLVNDEGLDNQIYIDSAATSSWEHGNPVHRGTRERLKKEGIGTDGMYSRILNDDDLSANYIIGMDKSNIENIKKFLKNRYSKYSVCLNLQERIEIFSTLGILMILILPIMMW